MEEKPLYTFEKPPVVEVALGLQFEPLGLGSGHLGWYWRSIAENWPVVSDAPPIPEQLESFPENNRGQLPQMGFRLLQGLPAHRLQLRNADGDRMVQVQDTRFIYNWIKKAEVYPRYLTIRHEFESVFTGFRDFLAQAQLAALHLNQWEVVYINHIPVGGLWSSPGDAGNVFPAIVKTPTPYGRTLFETFAGEWRSQIPDKRGRLYVNMQFQESQQVEVLAVVMTARGPIGADQEWKAGFELGHEAIVRTFVDISSTLAKDAWGGPT